VSQAWVEPVRSLLEAPSPAVLTTYRKDGSAHTVPVWYRWSGEAFEVVMAKGDVKLRHLARDPQCVLVVFEAVRRFVAWRGAGWPSWSRATSHQRGPQSLAAIAASLTASVSPPNGGPGQGCSAGSSRTVRGYGTCRESWLPDRPWTASRDRKVVMVGWTSMGRSGHSLGHSSCRNRAGQERTGWTTPLT
jgi:Pyridoxamine 5'-phosphate oxidase